MLEPGTHLRHYEVVAAIGVGGMGEVYRARDTKLGREVAIKVLPEDLAGDRERLARFEREAKLLAGLNHPNVATLHGLEECDGWQFLVMELVEGETLGERIARGPIPVEEALPLFIQIAQGMEAAHDKGVIHRDLKPANIMITRDGQIKILDFGLAKAFAIEEAGSAEASQSPTLTKGTALGAIMGTASYMSPEQARGKTVDKRTDVWAFGCCLYEALTGKKAFAGETVTDILGAVVRAEPDFSALPAASRDLVKRCLVKDPRERLRDIGDARIELGAARDEEPMPASGRRPAVLPFATALLGAAVAAALFWVAGPAATPAADSTSVMRTSITLPEGQRQPRLMSAPLAISPDGKLLAYVAQDGTGNHLFLRPLDAFESRKLPGTEDADAPFFSPDGQWVGFFAAGKLKKVSVDRGSSLTIADVSLAFGASWGADDVIVFARALSSGLWRVSADGGTPEQLTEPDFAENGYAHTWPQHLPDGRHVLFSKWGTNGAPQVLDLDTGDWQSARSGMPGGDMYLPSGHIIFSDYLGSGALLAAPFDLDKRVTQGAAVPVLDDVRYLDSMSARPFIAISETGTAVYVAHEIGEATLMWVDRNGDTTPVQTVSGVVAGVRLSPDGDTALFHDEQGSLWSLDIPRGSVDLLVNKKTLHSADPLWHPDGKRVIASSNDAGSWDLYEIDLAERSRPRPLLVRDFDQFARSWSHDGRLLAYVELHPETGGDIWVLPEDGEPVPVVQTAANEFSPVLSPDGRSLAYVSDESGRQQVYLRTYPEGNVLGVSIDGGSEPVWSRNGRELFFRRGDALLSATITTEPKLTVSTPTVLFEMPFDRSSFNGAPFYDVSPDGQRFLVVSERPTTELKVIYNWFQELERLVPTGK